jgi:hypothetical protein
VWVLGAEMIMTVRLQPAPAIEILTSSFTRQVERIGRPEISDVAASEAAARALETLAHDVRMKGRILPLDSQLAPQLVFFEPRRFGLTGASRLCWIVLRNGLQFLIDAREGAVVHIFERPGTVAVSLPRFSNRSLRVFFRDLDPTPELPMYPRMPDDDLARGWRAPLSSSRTRRGRVAM